LLCTAKRNISEAISVDSWQTDITSRSNTRSLGLKLIVVCTLALLMTIPSVFVSKLVSDRRQRADDVRQEISNHVGGPQTFLGPTVAIPYSVPSGAPNAAPTRGVYLIFPAMAAADIKTTTSERYRSLFRVPVFRADLRLESTFDLTGTPSSAPAGAEFDWRQAEIIVGVSNPRGALADAMLDGDGGTKTLVPSDLADQVSIGSEKARFKTVLLGTKLAGRSKPTGSLHVAATLKFSGAERIALLAYGKTTRVTARGDWPNPGFDGAILPVNRTVTARGFQAEWTVPFTARGVRAEGPSESMADLRSTAVGLSFIEVANSYQSVYRSLKYVLLILGLVFLCYFGFEVTTGQRVHPAQYVLVGLAQIIFYLLLLSLSERIGFDLGFLVAAGATVALLSSNAGWIFSNLVYALRALGLFSILYVLIYLLLRLEDNALLVGAISSFLAVALVMYLTRGVEWYGSPRRSSAGSNQEAL
ncbi:MAG: cell envelope integrity protein CreD, partial [Bryobacteraceae bacterium]